MIVATSEIGTFGSSSPLIIGPQPSHAQKVEHEITLGSWELCGTPPGEVPEAESLNIDGEKWLPALVPGTVAGALAAAGRWNLDAPLDLDACDWWYRTSFATTKAQRLQPCVLEFDGLATSAEVWLNGRRILTAENMFRRYRVDVTQHLQDDNRLAIVFRSLSESLKRKRPRPRWKTNLVAQQQLRWLRTSLFGRIPGWSPVAPIVGPWRDVRLTSGDLHVEQCRIVPQLHETVGTVDVEIQLRSTGLLHGATLAVGEHHVALQQTSVGEHGTWLLRGRLQLPDVEPWYPHTHGKPTLHHLTIDVTTDAATERVVSKDIGFRNIRLRQDIGFELRVNGESVYCRGACWTTADLLRGTVDEATLRRDLETARDAGVNMLRVGGTTVYESDAFYRLCDELGLLVWQDFMFANMDYPVDDAAFHAEIVAEAVEQLSRMAAHPAVVAYCGNSEIEQQAAMLGLPRDVWTNDWFSRELPELCAAYHPGTAYVPSTPTGGALPFHTREGITHYYGVGAYLRPLADVRRADVKFTPECLGFSNVPEPSTVDLVFGGASPVSHDPRWKRRIPRDGGAGWDFEDVRDHYLRELFDVDPVRLRGADSRRYWQLSRIITGEVMSRVYSEWRSSHGRNRGGLVWFYKDLWPGAGWGVVDSTGLPKPAYYQLKRVWQPRQLLLTDEGLNGIDLHCVNDTADAAEGTLELLLLKEPNKVVVRRELPVCVGPRSTATFNSEALLGRFYDSAYAYRFGPPHHDVVAAAWLDGDRNTLSEALHFVRTPVQVLPGEPTLNAALEQTADGEVRATLQTDALWQFVRATAKGYLPDDNYFHLVPGRTKTLTFRAVDRARPVPFRVSFEPVNYDFEASLSL